MNNTYKLAHRMAWELSNFEIPAGYVVCHLCDNPSCCNPHHLLLGTRKSNYLDMIKKNRQEFHKNKAFGSRNVNSKLDDQKVIEIRKKYKLGQKNQYELASDYGVSQTAIASVVNGKTWKHIGENHA